MKSIFTTALASAALVALAEADDLNSQINEQQPTSFTYTGNSLVDNTNIRMADNRITGDQIVGTRDQYGYFFRPSTIWDGCVRRAAFLDPELPKTSWWTLQSQIEGAQASIIELMYDLYGNDACKERQIRLFQTELKKNRNEDQNSTIDQYLLDEDDYLLSTNLSFL